MEKLLLIAIPDTDGVEQVARRLRLRTVLVQPEQYARSLGQLAGYPAAAAEETPAAEVTATIMMRNVSLTATVPPGSSQDANGVFAVQTVLMREAVS